MCFFLTLPSPFLKVSIKRAFKYFHVLLWLLQFNLSPCVSLPFQDVNICIIIKKGGEVTGFLEDIQYQEAHENFPQEFQEIPTLFWLSKFLLVLESTHSFGRPHISGKAINEQHLLAPVPIFCKELLVVVLWFPHIHLPCLKQKDDWRYPSVCHAVS